MQTFIQHCGSNDTGESLYQWRSRDKQGHWNSPVHTGTAHAMAQNLSQPGSVLVLMLDAANVITVRKPLTGAELKHLETLVPFELEESLLCEPQDIHVAAGPQDDKGSIVAYLDRNVLAATLEELAGLDLEIHHCIPFPLLLPRPAQGWVLALQDQQLLVHHGDGQSFSVAKAMAQPALQALLREESLPSALTLRAESTSAMQELQQELETFLSATGHQPELHTHIAPLWDDLSDPSLCPLDLRQGSFARRLPWHRWWQQGRNTAALAAVALLVFVAVQLLHLQASNQEFRALQQEITDVYRSVMPDGVLVDAEQQLRAQLTRREGGGAQVVPLLAQMAPLLVEQGGIEITRLSYNADRQELQLALSAQRNGDILALADALQAQGLQAQAQNFSRQGQQQVANLVIREAVQ